MRPSNKYIYIQFYIVSEGGKAKDCSKIILKIACSLRVLYMVVEISMLLEWNLITSLLLLIFLREVDDHILLKDYFQSSNNFSAQFIKIISHYKKIGYNINVLQQTACLVVNPITVGNFAFLFNCTPVGRTSDSMMVPT